MRFSVVAGALAASVLLATPAFAQSSGATERTVSTRGSTVFHSRDEDGRTRTRIIIQKRSYLDPGTEVLPGSQSSTDYAILPDQSRAGNTLNSTVYGQYQIGPAPFDIPSKGTLWGW